MTRWARYTLAWQHARQAERRGDRLRMTARDLICLNAYYLVPRPVFLISVAYAGRDNLFPMDLIGNVSSGELMLALRATSPAVELMERSRQVAMSAAPAREKEAIYALGAQHRLPSIDLNKLRFSMRPSPVLGLPILANGEMVREVAIQDVHRVGSHVLFVGSIIHESGQTEQQHGQQHHQTGRHVKGMQANQRVKSGTE